MATIVTQQQIAQSIYHLGLVNQALCVHASLRSYGHEEGGAPTVINGIIHWSPTVAGPHANDVVMGGPILA